MIKTQEQLAVVKEQLGRVERALESLRQDVKNPRNFAVYSESYVDQLNLLKAEIDEYLQRRKMQSPEVSVPRAAPEPQSSHVS
jgi:hypothetical protein